jgi:hypothetical protein
MPEKYSDQNVGRYGDSHCAMIVKRFVKIKTPMTIINTPDTISIV